MLSVEERRVIVSFKIEKAYKSFNEAKVVSDLRFWNLAGNRLYYAAFHMASALLLDKGMSAKSHAGVIHLLGQHFIATGILPKHCGQLISRLYELRQSGDYDDMYNATEAEIIPYIERTHQFLKDMEELITFKCNTNQE